MRAVSAVAVALALAGCVPAERGRVMERRLDRLEQDAAVTTRQLEEQRELIRDRVAKADAKIAEVQKKLDELNSTARRSGADVVARQDELERSLTQLRGSLEEEQHRLVALDQQLQQTRKDVDGRFAALKGSGALDQYDARRKLEALKRPTDPQAFLALAKQQDEAGEKTVARDLYDELSKRWPRDPATAEAQYRLGELSAAD